MKCLLCGKEFTGRRNKPFCYNCYSTEDYHAHADRYDICWKKYAILQKGGKCVICGYKKSLLALEFHHKDPTEKKDGICNMTRNNRITQKELDEELKKCILVCANCHAEIHDKDLTK